MRAGLLRRPPLPNINGIISELPEGGGSHLHWMGYWSVEGNSSSLEMVADFSSDMATARDVTVLRGGQLPSWENGFNSLEVESGPVNKVNVQTELLREKLQA